MGDRGTQKHQLINQPRQNRRNWCLNNETIQIIVGVGWEKPELSSWEAGGSKESEERW